MLNKNELVAEVAQYGFTQKQASAIIDAAINVAVRELKNGGEITLRGFGVFQTQFASARKGRNPKTGEEFHIPPRQVVRFKPGKLLQS